MKHIPIEGRLHEVGAIACDDEESRHEEGIVVVTESVEHIQETIAHTMLPCQLGLMMDNHQDNQQPFGHIYVV